MRIDGLHSTRPIEYEVVSPDDSRWHVRLPHLREGRRRSCGCSSSTSAPTVYRDGIRHYLQAATPTPTPSPPTCGTRSRRSPASRCATMMDTWILQGGHPLVTPRRRHPDPDATSPSARAPRRPSDRRVVARAGPHALARRRRPRRATCSATPPRRCRDDGPVVVNAGGSGVYRIALRRRAELARARPAPRRARRARARHPGRRHLGRASLRGHRSQCDDLSSTPRRAASGDQDRAGARGRRSVGVDHVLAQPRAHRGTAPGDPRVGPRALRARSFERLGWERARGEDDLARQLRGIARLGPRRRRRRPGGARRGGAPLRGRRTRRRPGHADPARRGRNSDPGDYATILERFRNAADPPGREALPLRARAGSDVEALARRPARAVLRRVPHPGRPGRCSAA